MDTKLFTILKYLSIINLLCSSSYFIELVFIATISKILPFTDIILDILEIIFMFYYMHKIGIIMVAAVIIFAFLMMVYLCKNKELTAKRLFGILGTMFCNIAVPFMWIKLIDFMAARI